MIRIKTLQIVAWPFEGNISPSVTNWLLLGMCYGVAILDDKGNIKGSMLMDFSSEAVLQKWLAREPYVTGKVWKTVQILKCKTRAPWQFNRSKEFFDSRTED